MRSIVIVDLNMAVVKILWKTLIAMRHRRFAKIIFNKNSFFTCLLRLLLISELNVARSWLLIVVFFLHWNGGARRPNKFTENERHSLLLLNGRPLVVGFNSLIWLVTGYWLDVPHLTILVRKDCHRGCPEAVVGEVRLYTSSLAHPFHHVVECTWAKWCIAVPNLLHRIKLCALAVSGSLKKSIWIWI